MSTAATASQTDSKATLLLSNKPKLKPKSEQQCFVLQRAQCVLDHWSKMKIDFFGFGTDRRNQTALRMIAVWEHLKCGGQLGEMVATTDLLLKENGMKFAATDYLTKFVPKPEAVDVYEKYSLEELYEDGWEMYQFAQRFAGGKMIQKLEENNPTFKEYVKKERTINPNVSDSELLKHFDSKVYLTATTHKQPKDSREARRLRAKTNKNARYEAACAAAKAKSIASAVHAATTVMPSPRDAPKSGGGGNAKK